jgi:hypothetical protein
MNYSSAITEVRAGKYAWWSGLDDGRDGSYIHLFGESEIYLYNSRGIGNPYMPTEGDQTATTWDTGDHPPGL